MQRILLTIALVVVALPAWSAIFYVRPTNGSDANAGTSFATAKQTFAGAISAFTAGTDTEIRLCAEATETTATEINIGLSGTTAAPVRIRGMDSTDGTTPASYTIQASAAMTNLIDLEAAGDRIKFENVVFDGNSNATNAVNLTDGSIACEFWKCEFKNATNGVNNDTGASGPIFTNCSFFDLTGDGVNAVSAGDVNAQFIACDIYDIGGNGLEVGSSTSATILITGCIFWDVTGDCVRAPFTAADNSRIIFNTFFYDGVGTTNAIDWPSPNSDDGVHTWQFNIFVGFATAIQTAGDDAAFRISNNLFYNNTVDIAGGTHWPNEDNVTSDPLFVSTTEDSEDFRLQSGSPAFQAAVGGQNLGALPTETDSGGGGGGNPQLVNGGLVK